MMMLSATLVSLMAITTGANPPQDCSAAEVSFDAAHIEISPVKDSIYRKPDGSPFVVEGNEEQVIVKIPTADIERIFSFVKSRTMCEAMIKIGAAEIERGLVASFLPLAFIGQNDKSLSLIANKAYALPSAPSEAHPVPIYIQIIGRFRDG